MQPLPSTAALGDLPGTVTKKGGADAGTGSQTASTPVDPGVDGTVSYLAPEKREIPLPRIPGFQVLRRLSSGGMGDVFEVVHLALQTTFALKMIRSDKTDGAFLTRFAREARAMVDLDHPHIARFYHFGEVDGCPYITMRFIRGTTLRDQIHSYRDDLPKAIALVVKIADAVQYLHERGNIHRDLKPSNILIDESGEPFLCDFGLVKSHSEPSVPRTPAPVQATTETARPFTAHEARELGITLTGEVWGTYAYMAPEQSRGEIDQISTKADVWALGVILYEVTTGKRPFASLDTAELLHFIRDCPVRKPRELNAQIDSRLEQIMLNCLEKSPADRYASAKELADELRQWLRSRDMPRKPNRRWIALGLGIGLLGILPALYFMEPKRLPAPEKPFDYNEWARSELAAGRSVVFIDDHGNPAWDFPTVVGENTSKIDRLNDQWTLHTTNTALVQFLDDPGIEDFILRAEIHDNKLATIGTGGMFVAQRRIEDPTGIWHYQVEVLFEENFANFLSPTDAKLNVKNGPGKTKRYGPTKIVARENPDGKGLVRLHALEEEHNWSVQQPMNGWAIQADAAEANGPWRKIEIEAHAASYRVGWEAQPRLSVELPIAPPIMQNLQRILKDEPGKPLSFQPRGGLGVTVEGGSASFRKVEIVPIIK